MTADEIARHFTQPDGSYAFARWNRPIAPVIFGVEESSLPVLKGAIEAAATLAGVGTDETDPEIGANLMIFFLRDWAELMATPSLGQLVPSLPDLGKRLSEEGASQYRFFRYGPDGAIRAAFLFQVMDADHVDLPAETLALTHAIQAILTWSAQAFDGRSPLALHPETGATILRPEVADLIRAAYDPVMPDSADDPSHALRLAARLGGGA